jgi:hypothetical protein
MTGEILSHDLRRFCQNRGGHVLGHVSDSKTRYELEAQSPGHRRPRPAYLVLDAGRYGELYSASRQAS